MLKPTSILLAAALLLALIVAGCGGGDDSPTKAEFTAEASSICKSREKERSDGVTKYTAQFNPENIPTKKEQEALVLLVILPPIEAMGKELSELDPPSGDEKQVEAFVNSMLGTAEELKENPDKILKAKKDPFLETRERAIKYGLKECGHL